MWLHWMEEEYMQMAATWPFELNLAIYYGGGIYTQRSTLTSSGTNSTHQSVDERWIVHHLSYSRATIATVTDTPFHIQFVMHCMKVATETCHLFFLSATEESLELVPTLCRFVAMLRASLSLECSCRVAINRRLFPRPALTTPKIALASWRPATVSARSLNCSALGKFGLEFGRWPTVIIHSDWHGWSSDQAQLAFN